MQRSILFFHSNIWYAGLRALLLHLQREHGCRVVIVSELDMRARYRRNIEAGAHWVELPNFMRKEAWEADPEENQRLDEFIRTCEKKLGVGLNRMLLAAERDLGRAYSLRSYPWPRTRRMRYCLKDSANPAKIARRHFHFLRELMELHQTDLVLSRESCSPLAFTARFISTALGIPHLTCRYSKIISERVFWTDDYHMYNTRADEAFSAKLAAGEQPTEFARQRITAFRDQPAPLLKHHHEIWKQAEGRGFWRTQGDLLNVLRENIRFIRKGGRGHPPKPFLGNVAEFYRTYWYRRVHRHYFSTFTPEELKGFSFVYYALHKEPEMMLNFESPLWHDQFHAIKYLSSILPSGLRLLVKENRQNWGRRRTQYLNALSRLPGVTLVNPFDSQFKYIANAAVTITDNGSTGWEALLLRQPVITTEKTLYDAPAVARTIADPRTLDAAILDALERPTLHDPDEHDRRLGLFIDAENETTLTEKNAFDDLESTVRYINQLLQRQGS